MGLGAAILDRSIVFSFDRSGYERHARGFSSIEADLRGQNVLVTGANGGLGYATCEGLLPFGPTIHMLCRSLERGEKARAELKAKVKALGSTAKLELHRVDVSEAESIDRFASSWNAPIDALVHNAGVLLDARGENSGGFELTYATNILGQFRLTARVQQHLADDARLVLVASGGMYGASLDVDELIEPPGRAAERFNGVNAYAMTKRAQVVLAEQLAERLPHVHVSAMHPGWADTPGVATSLPGFSKFMDGRLRTPAEGADTIVWLVASNDARPSKGRFFFDRAPAKTHLWFKRPAPDEERERLWARLCLDADTTPDFEPVL
ncbi:MAG: SDR family NAD(P)-dependent oxidoreductase [Myxococcota bacterium]